MNRTGASRRGAAVIAAAAGMVLAGLAGAQEIRTPAAAPTPRVNGPTVFGARPNSAFMYKIPATGSGTITYSAAGLPAGLSVNSTTGLITGTVTTAGNYNVTLGASNSLGSSTKNFTIKIGGTIGLTPAMGWNSWNVWAGSVTAAKVKAAADAFVSFDLINHGWSYVNTDDHWQGARSGPFNGIQANSTFLGGTFTDMGAQVNYIHGLGLKAGIYSTPWIQSYGGFIGGSANNAQGTFVKVNDNSQKVDGTFSFATNDANQWAAWGIDYLKYDWNPRSPNPVSNTQFHTETATMQQALLATNRDVLYSYSNSMPFDQISDQQPMLNSWRISGDITDSWSSMSGKGFGQDKWAPYAGPGHFNDPDMLEVGWVGKSANPHPTNLTPDEQYTHMTIWSLVSAPLLLGCDLTKLDAFTLNLITNDEVIAVDQDALGEQALRKTNITTGNGNNVQVYLKNLEDGTQAVGLFNLGTTSDTVTASWADLGISGARAARDLWRQTDLGEYDGQFSMTIPSHGAELIKLAPPPVVVPQMIWNGAADGTTWNFSAANFNENAANVPFANGKAVGFTDSAPANATNINVAVNVSPGAVVVNASSRSFTFSGSGAIAGTGSLVKSGSSTLTILNANSYTGTTTINGGTIMVGGTAGSLGFGNVINNASLVYNRSNSATVANNISGSGSITHSGGGTLILTGNNTYSGATNISAGRTLQIGDGGATGSVGSGPVSNAGILVMNRSGTTSISGIITGSGSLVQMGTGTVVLGATNAYTGTTTISSGIVTATGASGTTSSLGAVPGGDVTISGGALNLGGGIAGSNALNSFGQKVFHIAGSGGGLGAITNRNYVSDASGNTGANQQLNALLRVVLDVDATIAAPSLGFDGAYSGGNVLGRIDIRGANSGGTNTAQLNLNGHNLTKSGGSFFDLVNCDVTGTGNIIVSATAGNTLCLESNTKIFDDGGTSKVIIGDGAMLEFWAQGSAGATNMTRRVEMGDGTAGSVTYLSQGGGSSNTIGMPILLKGNLSIRPTNANQNNTSLTMAASISQDATARKLIKTNVGTLTLSGNNTFTGGLDLNVGTAPVNGSGTSGMVVLGSATALHSATIVSFGPASGYVATLRLNANSPTIGGLRTMGTAGTSIVENASNTNATLTVSNLAAQTFAGTIQDGSGTGKLSVVKAGVGVLMLGGSNTYTGDTTISAGTLAVASSGNLGDPGNKIVLNGGTLRTDAPITSTRKIQLSSAGGANSNGFDSSWDDMTGGGNFTKSGAGRVTVRRIVAGNVLVNAGVLGVKDRASNGGNIPAQIGSLTVSGSAALDLKDNDLIVSSGSFTSIRALVLSGFGSGSGITTSTSNGSQILALFDNALVGVSDWNGASVSANAIIGKYTYFGDTNIDGQVSGDDYTVIDASLNTDPAAGLEWLSGDMNLDGIVTGDDYTVIDANLGLGAGNPLAASRINTVPEPAVGAMLLAMGLLARRRRR